MKNKLPFLLLFAFLINNKTTSAQSSTSTLDVIGWNLEFFGAPYASGPTNKDLQEANAKKLMRYFDADIYGLVEIVDTMRLRRVRDSLGTNFEYIIAPYSTDGPIGTNGWRQSQKLAFLYKKDIFSNISTRGMMLNSPTAVSNWASGRMPFLLKADATINGITNVFILGDFNDALNASIYSGASVSSYTPLISDSTDSDHYKSITLPLGYAGQTSMINFPNVIDNHVISNEVVPFYVLNSAQIRTDVTAVVPDYVTAHNTSDHSPVFSKYSLAGIITGLPTVNPNEFGIRVSPNPFIQTVNIKASKTLTNVQLRLVNMQGQVVTTQSYGIINSGSSVQPIFPLIPRGIYFLQVETKQYRTVIKLTHL